MIELINVNKSFGDTHVLFDVNLVFNPGQSNFVIGASGCGKSVLMKCMVGLEKPETGNIFYDGRDFLSFDKTQVREVRREIGMLFQGTALFDSLTVEQNISFPLEMFTEMTKKEIQERVNFCLSKVNLKDCNHKYPAEISGGMKKRVGIARAIALNTKYLFCDEPNSGLDPVTSRVIDSLLKDITEEFNITTISNTHDMKTVFDVGDKIIFIYEGKIKWEGDRTQIKSASKEVPELNAFMQASFFD
jgi:phospholipid/cholesterol/gamma-HCH transport system ATP-binding protein